MRFSLLTTLFISSTLWHVHPQSICRQPASELPRSILAIGPNAPGRFILLTSDLYVYELSPTDLANNSLNLVNTVPLPAKQRWPALLEYPLFPKRTSKGSSLSGNALLDFHPKSIPSAQRIFFFMKRSTVVNGEMLLYDITQERVSLQTVIYVSDTIDRLEKGVFLSHLDGTFDLLQLDPASRTHFFIKTRLTKSSNSKWTLTNVGEKAYLCKRFNGDQLTGVQFQTSPCLQENVGQLWVIVKGLVSSEMVFLFGEKAVYIFPYAATTNQDAGPYELTILDYGDFLLCPGSIANRDKIHIAVIVIGVLIILTGIAFLLMAFFYLGRKSVGAASRSGDSALTQPLGALSYPKGNAYAGTVQCAGVNSSAIRNSPGPSHLQLIKGKPSRPSLYGRVGSSLKKKPSPKKKITKSNKRSPLRGPL